MDGLGNYRGMSAFLPVATLVMGSVLHSAAPPACATSPKVVFDVSQTVECRDVTPPEFAQANPDEKVIEAEFQLSTLLLGGAQRDIDILIMTVLSPQRRLRVVGFAPATQLASDIVGEIEKVDTREVERTTKASIGGALSAAYGIGKIDVAPSVGAGNTRRETSKSTYRSLPAKETVLVSGTIHAGYGVFFKFKPSPQVALEGTRRVVCRYAVPRSWRGDWALVSCQARRQTKGLFSGGVKPCGQKRIPVALYLRGDREAKRAALALARAEGARLEAARSAKKKGTVWAHVVLKPILGDRAKQAVLVSSRSATASASRDHSARTSGRPPLRSRPEQAISQRGTVSRASSLATLRELSGSR